MRLLLSVACLLGARAARTSAQTSQASAAPGSGTIAGVVLAREGDVPLGYSVVSVPALGRELFTDDVGRFTIAGVPAGAVQLRVKHIGYTPTELTVTVRADRTDTVRVRLARVAVQLSEVRVRAYPECKNPGPPRAASDPAFAAVFEQLEQNAQQLRLLSDAYPFQSLMQRVDSLRRVSGDIEIERFDTLLITSKNKWTYKPGSVVERSEDRWNRSVFLNVPSLIHFADKVFIANHCFYNGGTEVVDGAKLLRIDFIAASRIKQPDVDGSMYLDPATFQIRRSVLRLTKIPPDTPGILSTEVVTLFKEILPSIPVISAISSVNTIEADSTRPILVNASFESQRLLRVVFLKAVPGSKALPP